MVETFPYTYFAYGLTIASKVPIIGFKEMPVNEPDVTISKGYVPEKLNEIVSQSSLFQSNDHELLFSHKPAGRYYISGGSKIVIQKTEGVKDSDLSSVIVGICFGAILNQRRLLPLHASTVFYRNKCIVIAGKSGAGKTTLATAFIKTGAMLIADDVSLVKFINSVPEIVPAFPTIKIWSDSLQHLGMSSGGLVPVRDEIQKYYLPVDHFHIESTPIDHIIILSTHNGREPEIHNITGYAKFLELRKYTYLHSNFSRNDFLVNHFQLATNLASKVPVHKLKRSKNNFDTDQLIEVISKNIGIFIV